MKMLAAGALLLVAPMCRAYARVAGGGDAALVEPTRVQYTYHLEDNLLLCQTARLEHRLTLANASNAALLGFEDPELQLWLRTRPTSLRRRPTRVSGAKTRGQQRAARR